MDLLRGGLVLAGLLGVYAILFGGLRRRPGAPGKAPFGRYRSVGSDHVGAVTLAVLAVLLTAQVSDVLTGAIAGLLLGPTLSWGLRAAKTFMELGMSGIGVIAAFITAERFITDQASSQQSSAYRIALVGAVLLVFAATTLAFGRAQVLSGPRGLTLFGLVDVVTFAAGPGGADIVALDHGRQLVVVLLSLALAMVLGFAASPFLLSATALLATSATILLSILHVSGDQTGPAAAAGAIAAGLIALRIG